MKNLGSSANHMTKHIIIEKLNLEIKGKVLSRESKEARMISPNTTAETMVIYILSLKVQIFLNFP